MGKKIKSSEPEKVEENARSDSGKLKEKKKKKKKSSYELLVEKGISSVGSGDLSKSIRLKRKNEEVQTVDSEGEKEDELRLPGGKKKKVKVVENTTESDSGKLKKKKKLSREVLVEVDKGISSVAGGDLSKSIQPKKRNEEVKTVDSKGGKEDELRLPEGKKRKAKMVENATKSDSGNLMKKKKSSREEVIEVEEISSQGNGQLLMNIQLKRKKEKVKTVAAESDLGGPQNCSTEEGMTDGLRLPKGKRGKKNNNSEVCMDGDSVLPGESSLRLMTTEADVDEKKREKKSIGKKFKGDSRNKELKRKDEFSKDGSGSGVSSSLSAKDDEPEKKHKENANAESGGKHKENRPKLKDLKVAKSISSPDAAFSRTKVADNATEGQQIKKVSPVRSNEKKERKKKKAKNEKGYQVHRKQKNMKPKKHSVEGDQNSPVRSDKTSSKSSLKKKVHFSGKVEVFPSNCKEELVGHSNKEGWVIGKRYTAEEDELIRKSVLHYIKVNNLGEDGLQKVLNPRSHREVRGCWNEIGAAIPWRPVTSVYGRGQILFRRSEKRKWEPEELEFIQRYQREHGAKWKAMADILGKYRLHVKDAWRRHFKLANEVKGKWSQEEYQSLFDLVNADLRIKAFEEKKSKHGMLRENISWGSISTRMKTRTEMFCCTKWYSQLTSPMVLQGYWADTDDYLLIDRLLNLDACCIEEVDWDSLLDHRPGDVCLRRWREMRRHIGGGQERSFMEQVEILASRYCLKMMEYRTGTGVESGEETL